MEIARPFPAYGVLSNANMDPNLFLVGRFERAMGGPNHRTGLRPIADPEEWRSGNYSGPEGRLWEVTFLLIIATDLGQVTA
jgi:hypothetical protein